MLSTVVIGTDQRMLNYLLQVCGEFANICVYKTIPLTARPYEIAAAMSRFTPDVAFLVVSDTDTAELDTALPGLQEVLAAHPETALIPVTSTPEGVWRHHRALGPAAAVALVCPFSAEEFQKVVLGAMERKPTSARGLGHVMAIMPSKPGAGASTVAVNVAGVLASQSGKKVLLVDGDFHSGSIPVLLNLKPGEYALNGVDDQSLLTEAAWPRAVSGAHGMDVLVATMGTHAAKGSLWDYHRLLGFARQRYDVVVVDLRDVVDEMAVAAIGNADRVYMVSTPDPASLALVARRVRELEREGIRVDHMEYVLNRHAPDDRPAKEVSAAIRQPFSAVLPEDARPVKEAMNNCRLVASKSAFGRETAGLAQTFLRAVDPRHQPESPRSLRKLVTNALGF